MIPTLQQPHQKSSVGLGKQRSYQEIISFLNQQWSVHRNNPGVERIQKLDLAFNSPSKQIPTIFVAGTNGKSLTINFTTKLLREEGLTVGAYYTPHLIQYNERIVINHEAITNKLFTDLANDVINTSLELDIEVNTAEILIMMALLHFKNNNVDVAILEINEATQTMAALYQPKITAITRIVMNNDSDMEKKIKEVAQLVQKDTLVICADQSKRNLQLIHDTIKEQKSTWVMPIRKLAPLSYPFEQLHGRCAALAERIAQLYLEKFITKNATIINNSLLIKPKGQRGRPTLEAKRQSELNPKRTLEQFWKEETNTLPCRFQLLEKEKPTILLDNASNLDALKNLFLGIRLLHYQRPFKGLAIIIGAHKEMIETEEFLKLSRYFFKKTSGSLIFCPVPNQLPQENEHSSWDAEKIGNEAKNLKIKARATKSFAEAFETAKKNVDERHGLIVIAGSNAVVNEYLQYRGMKRL